MGHPRRAFLPPLKLTLAEAMAVFLSARLMVRYADKYDPDLASAFEKLAADLPETLREHVARSLDVLPGRAARPGFIDHVRQLTRAWAERRVVEIEYEGARVRGRAARAPRERPAVPDRAVAADPRPVPDRLGRGPRRDADVQDRAHPRRRVTPRAFEPRRRRRSSGTCAAAGTSSRTSRRWRSCCDSRPSVADRVTRDDVAPAPARRARSRTARWLARDRRGTIEIRLWILSWGDDVEVLEPAELRQTKCPSTRAAEDAGGWYRPGRVGPVGENRPRDEAPPRRGLPIMLTRPHRARAMPFVLTAVFAGRPSTQRLPGAQASRRRCGRTSSIWINPDRIRGLAPLRRSATWPASAIAASWPGGTCLRHTVAGTRARSSTPSDPLVPLRRDHRLHDLGVGPSRPPGHLPGLEGQRHRTGPC